MRRLARIAAISIALVVGVPLLLLAVLIAGGNTGEGRLLIIRAAASLSGGAIKIDGLSGRFPARCAPPASSSATRTAPG